MTVQSSIQVCIFVREVFVKEKKYAVLIKNCVFFLYKHFNHCGIRWLGDHYPFADMRLELGVQVKSHKNFLYFNFIIKDALV